MTKTITLALTLLFASVNALAQSTTATKFVGGDISMLTKYEEAGVVYKDKSGNAVQPLAFFKQEGLNAMRVRLFVDPSRFNDKAVCQDINYVMALGKRIKAAGMSFMLDFHYSDTWADPSNQWTPDAWKSMNDTQLATIIYDYTKDCLTKLKAGDATPDFIQTGNEISYGMLWGAEGTSSPKYCYTNSPTANWTRFYTFLKQAGKACREVCPNAKIVLHSERAATPSILTDYFDRMKTNSIDYDIIGLSYYPDHHKDLATLETALTTLENKNYGKDIMIVETGYGYQWGIGTEYDYTATYPRTEEGQRQFTADLITMLNKHSSVTGLFWWWMEDNGNTKVTDNWWNAGLYNHSSGAPYAAFYELKKFVGGEDNSQEKDVTSQYITNASFDSDISGWTNTGGTAQWKQNTWPPLSNYCEFTWTGNAIADQEVEQTVTLPAGTYTLTVNCASDANAKGIYLIAGEQSKEMVGTGNVGTFSLEFTLSTETAVKIGLKLQSTTATWVNFDNFILQRNGSSNIESVTHGLSTKHSPTWYNLDGRRLTSKPITKGVYVNNGRKILTK